MVELIESQDTNSKIMDRIQEESDIASKATEIAIEQSGLQGMFKPQSEKVEDGWPTELAGDAEILYDTNGYKVPAIAKPAENKKTRKINKAPQTGKTLTVDEVLLKLEAQTQAVKWVQCIANPDIPKMSYVKVRELLISMQSQIDKIKSETLANIQAV